MKVIEIKQLQFLMAEPCCSQKRWVGAGNIPVERSCKVVSFTSACFLAFVRLIEALLLLLPLARLYDSDDKLPIGFAEESPNRGRSGLNMIQWVRFVFTMQIICWPSHQTVLIITWVGSLTA